ncbi:hypothetical protein UCDDA912_g10783 [Diaporthe ampelina]|uniref:Uncharacterized protein n=1 Tax=Diaporthe ampelina TaxID=1214573 RepID=A0A0G2HLW2_9PEZI|nr:hypothetical protein UCDDA912_g10783 [Diaporthe ampelina]
MPLPTMAANSGRKVRVAARLAAAEASPRLTRKFALALLVVVVVVLAGGQGPRPANIDLGIDLDLTLIPILAPDALPDQIEGRDSSTARWSILEHVGIDASAPPLSALLTRCCYPSFI